MNEDESFAGIILRLIFIMVVALLWPPAAEPSVQSKATKQEVRAISNYLAKQCTYPIHTAAKLSRCLRDGMWSFLELEEEAEAKTKVRHYSPPVAMPPFPVNPPNPYSNDLDLQFYLQLEILQQLKFNEFQRQTQQLLEDVRNDEE